MLLLDTPFSKNGRGSLYERICIDLVHLKMYAEGIAFAKKGLEDSSVKMGDRVIIQRRLVLIQIKQSKLAVFSSPLLSFLNVNDSTSIVSFHRIIEYFLNFNNSNLISNHSTAIKSCIHSTSETKISWACVACTYINTNSTITQCVICNTARFKSIDTVSTLSNSTTITSNNTTNFNTSLNNSNTNTNSDIICLLSDSDNDLEEEGMNQSERKREVGKSNNNFSNHKAVKRKKKKNSVDEEIEINSSNDTNTFNSTNEASIKDEVNGVGEEAALVDEAADLIDLLHEGDLELLGLPSTISGDNSDIDIVTIKGRRFGDPKRKGKKPPLYHHVYLTTLSIYQSFYQVRIYFVVVLMS
jgi:hypothetical protein